jgi:flagellar biosynthesis/type III secretory pathway M-ring protein FliF/YscJ
VTSVWERFFGKYWEQVKRLLASLAPSQRITIGILAATVFIGLLVVAFFTGQGGYTALARHKDLTELQRMATKLQDAGYGVRVENGTLEVKQEQLPQALNYVASSVNSTPRRDGWGWLDQDPQWGDTSVRLTEKVKRAKTINVEESIKVCPDLVDALVELNIKREPLTVMGGTGDGNSASVIVTLAPGIGRLSPGQVRVIRNIVSGGAPVPFAAVKVTDNKLNEYALEDDDNGDGAGFDERRLAQIKHYKREIASYLERTFRECEYSLFVDVKLNREKVQSDAETVTPPKKPVKVREREEKENSTRATGGDSVGVARNVNAAGIDKKDKDLGDAAGAPVGASATVDTEDRTSTEIEYAPLVGRTTEKTMKPAGNIEKISVAVRIDKSKTEKVVGLLGKVPNLDRSKDIEKALEEVRGKTGLDEAVDAYRQDMETEIGKMLLAVDAKPTVSVQTGIMLLASQDLNAPAVRTVTASEWLFEHATLIACALFGLAALGFVYTLARRSIPAPIEIPPVELPEERQAVAAANAKTQETAAEAVAELNLEDDEFSGGVQQIAMLSKDRPGLAASVVKMWIGTDPRAAAAAAANAEQRE